jgi:hypothetical protein
LSDVTDAFVGLQTSADDVFILRFERRSRGIMQCYSKSLDESVELESPLLHPLVSGTDVRSFEPFPERQFILFPYRTKEESATLIPMSVLKRDFPSAARYLMKNRERLEGRENSKFADSDWHRFGRSQNLGIQERVKLCVPRLVDHLHAGFDQRGKHYLDNVDVGGVTWKPKFASRSMKTLLAMLNSQVLRWFFPQISAPFRGGFRSANRQFLELLPIADSSKDQDKSVEHLVNILIALHGHFTIQPDIKNTRDHLMLSYWERALNGLIYELYFPEDVHEAGLRLFDLVDQGGLPDVNAIPERERLPQLRRLFETFYDGSHPWRIALDKLQTLDAVRVIEGKA